jgi:hypothetical protein
VPGPSELLVVSLVGPGEADRIRLALDSLREFGGELASASAWVYSADAGIAGLPGDTTVRSLDAASRPSLPFAAKVAVCAQAEAAAAGRFGSMLWLCPESLVLRPPLLYRLGPDCAAAFRPVHIANVGSRADAPADPYWQAVYDACGIADPGFTVESFVDRATLRPYFNTHCFAVDPNLGLMREWLDLFNRLAGDAAFLAGPCADPLHRVFLHQAVLSALVARRAGRERIRLLPPDYNYPLNLHDRVPEDRRARALDELTLPVYEEAPDLRKLAAAGPLGDWLDPRLPAA